MTERLTHCDKCGSKIEDGRCSCGIWYERGEQPPEHQIIQYAIEAYTRMYASGKAPSVFTADHFSGSCIALFRGNYEDCMKVSDFIESLQEGK